MANIQIKKGTIAILTGGGDVPGLNPAIRAITLRALQEGFQVIGLRRGWTGIMEMVRDKTYDNSDNYMVLTSEIVKKAGRTGGTFLHTSRTRPSHVPVDMVPSHLKHKYSKKINDLTVEVIKNLDYLGVDFLIPIGGDDTLSYAVRMHKEGVKVIAIPKTMENDVPGTDYCIGFSTCITRTIGMINNLRISAGSHERILIVEVFGRYSGFTAMLPTLAGAANRCVIPEHKFNIEKLSEIMVEDRNNNPSKYSILLVSEGAIMEGMSNFIPHTTEELDENIELPGRQGMGEIVANKIKNLSAHYNDGKTINIISQKLGYMVRGGDPDAIDSIVPMAFGNMALDLIIKGIHGRLVILKNGCYDNAPIDIISTEKKFVDITKNYNTERYRPQYKSFEFQPLFAMTGAV